MLWKLFVALSLIGITKSGDHIEKCPQGNYAWPTICDVDHKHHPRKECKHAKGKRNIREESRQAVKEKKQKRKIGEYNGKAK